MCPKWGDPPIYYGSPMTLSETLTYPSGTHTDPDIARTVAFLTIKGGVGKTAMSAAVASEAARLGARVLVIDFDANAAMTSSQFGIDPEGTKTIGDVLIEGRPGGAADAILSAPGEWQPNHDLPWDRGGALLSGGALGFIPCNHRLDLAIKEVEMRPRSEDRLATVLRGVARDWDLVVIDPGPRSDRPTWLVTLASGHVLSPVFPESQSIDGIERTLHFVEEFADIHPDLRYLGTAVTRYVAQKTRQHGQNVQDLRDLLSEPPVDVDGAPFRHITHTGACNVPDTTSGSVVLPEVIPDAAYTLGAHTDRLPIHYGMLPAGDEPVDASELSFTRRSALNKARAHTMRYTRLALRLLLVTSSPALQRIDEALTDRPIHGLWPDVSLKQDGTDHGRGPSDNEEEASHGA